MGCRVQSSQNTGIAYIRLPSPTPQSRHPERFGPYKCVNATRDIFVVVDKSDMFGSENVKYMWLNDLFLGIRNTFVGKYHFLVINDHLWGPSVHVDKSFKKIQVWVRPLPHQGNACILGTLNPATHPLKSQSIFEQQPMNWRNEITADSQISHFFFDQESFLCHCCQRRKIKRRHLFFLFSL